LSSSPKNENPPDIDYSNTEHLTDPTGHDRHEWKQGIDVDVEDGRKGGDSDRILVQDLLPLFGSASGDNTLHIIMQR
jgi:hypothetical protein